MFSYGSGKEVQVTEETMRVNPYTWPRGGDVWELDSITEFYSHIPSDKSVTIVDIGAQSGLYTLYAKFLPLAKYYAFEPFPKSYKCLLDNLNLNGINNVQPSPLGISNQVGSTELNVCTNHYGLNTLGATPIRFSSNQTEKLTIETTTIDHLFPNNPVDFIKCDTEGWELRILQGGEELIKRCKPLIQIEYNEINMKQCGIAPSDLDSFLTVHNYKLLSIKGEERIYQ